MTDFSTQSNTNARPTRRSPYLALLRTYVLSQWQRAAWMMVLLLSGIALQLVNPQIIRFFLDTAQSGGPQQALWWAAAAFFASALLLQMATLLARLSSKAVSWHATNRLRADLMLHSLRLDMPFHKQHTPGEMIERVDGDVSELGNFFSEFVVNLLGNALLIVGILALLFRENFVVGVGMTVYALIALTALGMIQNLAVSRWAAARQASAEQYGYLEERIAGAEEIQTLGAMPYAIHRFLVLSRTFLQKQRAAYVIGSVTYNLTNLLYVAGYAAGLALGVWLYLRGEATLGTVYLITHYVGMLSEPLQSLRSQAQDFQQAAASIGRIQTLLDEQPANTLAAGQTAVLAPGALSLTFDHVSFHYEAGDDVVRDLSFTLPAGQTLGILGRTGSGKSTLTRLLFRLYDPGEGEIYLGSAPTTAIAQSTLRQRVGMVTQDVQLFQASVRDNLTFFNHGIRDAEIETALRHLTLWEWVQGLPHGLDTLLSVGGQGISAGEAQMLAFARVFLKNPGLVILDEASSRLDPATETLLERAVDQLFAARTGMIIAHRLSTVNRADWILILEAGQCIEFGLRTALAADPSSHFAHYLRTGLEEVLA